MTSLKPWQYWLLLLLWAATIAAAVMDYHTISIMTTVTTLIVVSALQLRAWAVRRRTDAMRA